MIEVQIDRGYFCFLFEKYFITMGKNVEFRVSFINHVDEILVAHNDWFT